MTSEVRLEDLLDWKAFAPEMAMFMEAAVKARLNIMVSGGPLSGKTSLLAVLDTFIPRYPSEVQLADSVVAKLQALFNRNGKKGSLLRPKRNGTYVLAECHGPQAPLLLKLIIFENASVMTAIAGLNPQDAIERFLAMTIEQGYYPPGGSALQDVAAALSVIIHTQLFPDGSRKCASICELMGVSENRFVVQEIFAYDPPNGSISRGQFRATGFIPSFLPRFEPAGIRLPANFLKARVLLKD